MITLGSKVRLKGEIYEVIDQNDDGSFDIANVIHRNSDGFPCVVTNVKNNIYANEMEEIK